MLFRTPKSLRIVVSLATLMMLAMAVVPSTLAVDPPAISVNPVWRPASQLDSINPNSNGVTDSGDDLRYVDADIFINTSVQFWAADMTCTVDKTVLETYTPNTDVNGGPSGNGINSPDDVQPVTYGTEWSLNGNFLQNTVNTVNTDGKINFVATRTGSSNPIGNNGIKTTILLATLRYRTKALTAAKTSPLTCTAAFLDKNGKTVLVPTVVAPAPLSVITDYTIKGKVLYQDQAVQTGIIVNCKDSLNGDHFGTPTAAGDFTVTTRVLGNHDCYFYGSKINADTTTEDSHLTARTSFQMNSATYTLLPVILRTGNTARVGTKTVDLNDFNMITANWNKTTATAFTNGDANGDLKSDKADLALVAGNYGLSETINGSHFIYSLPRDNERFMNSRIWIGGYYADPSVSQFVPGTDRNYWATLSSDGTKIAFVRNIGTGNVDKFALFVAPVTGGVVGAAVNITPNAAFDAFAPSWSPDGATIAFACAYSRADWTDASGVGNLCLIASDGKNLRQKIPLPASRDLINIHPVAWYNNTSLMYGGPSWVLTSYTPTCDYEICTLDLTTMANSVDPRIPSGADMPAIRWGVMGPVVFYRYSTGYNSYIRFAELNETYTTPVTAGLGSNSTYSSNCAASPVGAKHCDVINSVVYQFPGYDKIGYFNVYSGNSTFNGLTTQADNNQYGIVAYSQDLQALDGGGRSLVLLDWYGGNNGSNPAWSKFYFNSYSVNNMVGNPALGLQDYNPATEQFMALRNTIEWVP